jgi:isoquinoline 1-oxidoreductase alpha subunit
MAKYTLNVNNQQYDVDAEQGTSLLWVLREHLGLTGAKYSCGIGQCGACTIHVDNIPVKACILSIDGIAKDQQITTIEGLSENNDHPLQKAWIEVQAPQCGYCHAGQIMQAASLLANNDSPSRDEIKSHMNGNLCRCGTYLRIIDAIELASKQSNS